MIESVIYWTGVSVLILTGWAITVLTVWISALLIRNQMAKDLKSMYNHLQLRYMMKVMEKKGLAQAIEDLDKNAT